MLISQKIEQLAVKHDDSRRVVGTYLLNEGIDVESRSMQQVADETFTSKSTLVRIAKQLGFSGWNALVRAYVDELKYQTSHFATNVDHNVPFVKTSTPQAILDALCQIHMESVWQSRQTQNVGTIIHATDLIWHSRRVALFGISVNEMLLKLFQRKLLTIGIPALMVPQAEYKLLAHSLTDHDCAIMVSYSGSGKQRTPMNLIPILELKGTPIIALTSEGDNYLRQHAQAVLSICSQEKLYTKVSTFSTESSISYSLDCLFAMLFARDYDRNLTNKVALEESIETNRYATKETL
ncbi:MurR/RpiR family transcriptional regulator [Collinsella sp. An2]|uniref:MurR/RpiR family transcriptional regulator n=1 Tax=Collinsella sp. An2 TaxID=1965585 RepID=UPI000B3AF9DB|nr:MurR/RpiR family transcriptional regulator [Collinsella sp. An2]OUP09222.1 hypothetical protein B5F33_05680 [Collinsella sp. An2]